MKNSIKVTIPFSFKGIERTPSSIIDLDLFIRGDQNLDSVLHHVANENKIDNYSYEYEVLESSPKIFSDATGLATKYLHDNGTFDLDSFTKEYKNSNTLEILQSIANQTLNIKDLNENKELKDALEQAYRAGENKRLN